MDLSPTREQDDLIRTAAAWLVHRWPDGPIPTARDRGPDGGSGLGPDGGAAGGPAFDPADWAALGRQGWLDAELGVVELGLLAIETGRALHPRGWLVSMAATPLLGGPPARPVTLADDPPSTTASATAAGGVALTGDVRALEALGDLLVLVPGDGLFLVGLDSPGVCLTRPATLDPWRRPATVRLDRAPGRLLAAAGAGLDDRIARARERRDVLLSAEAVGVARYALETARTYAGQREQFGRVIGSYQAVAHALAEVYTDLALAESLAYRAMCLLAEDGGADHEADQRTGPAARAAAVAEAAEAATAAAVHACESAIQVLGGIGVTWEHPLHWWYRRALWHRAARSGPADPLLTVAAHVFGG